MDFSLRRDSVRPTFSVEFFPPKDEVGETRLWDSLGAIAKEQPDFVSVTYGAGGSTRDRTIRVTSEITSRTSFTTVAHLTCVGATRDEIDSVLDRYQESGISAILALRGDPAGGPRSPWVINPDGLNHADELVEIAVARNLTVGVAAFPDGHPASSGDFEQDVKVLMRKFDLGATFATTQFFFDVSRYEALRDRLQSLGYQQPIIAGILPITNVKQLIRMADLGGTALPREIVDRISRFDGDVEAVKREGVEIASELVEKLIAIGAPGVHFYTMNSAASTIEVIKRVGLR
jgi:methylenetetrahydrofolate reductase (NADPH)